MSVVLLLMLIALKLAMAGLKNKAACWAELQWRWRRVQDVI